MGRHDWIRKYATPAPWIWLYVSAALVGTANVLMSQDAYPSINNEIGFFLIASTIGMYFGHVTLAAFWAAWGPGSWGKNYAVALGSLLLYTAIMASGAIFSWDDVPQFIFVFEITTAIVLGSLLLVALHSVRYFGRWRLLVRGAAENGRPFQLSLRGMLVATALAAAIAGLGRWWLLQSGSSLLIDVLGEILAITLYFALLIGTAMIGPILFWFAIVVRRRRALLICLALTLGYFVPLLVIWLVTKLNFDGLFGISGMQLSVQCGVAVAGALGAAMLRTAGVRAARQLPEATQPKATTT